MPQGCCACSGMGPALSQIASEFFRRFGPNEQVRNHFQQARVEVLKGLRALIDQRINDLSQPAQAKGTHVAVD